MASRTRLRFLARAWLCAWILALAAGSASLARAAGPLDHPQALAALGHADPAQRLAAMQRLADIGTAADADAVLPRLSDPYPALRRAALALVWQLWSRSGDPRIDGLYQQAIVLMQSGQLPKAVQAFTDIIVQRPSFAEAWNKRATIYYMMDQYALSMKDCDEVLARVPKHFGALSGYAAMLAERGQPERALAYLERAHQVHPDMTDAKLMLENLRRQIDLKRRNSA